MALGVNGGVANNTKLIGVKFKSNTTLSVPSKLVEAWSWMIADVNAKGRNGKAIMVLSYSYSYSQFIDNNGYVNNTRLNNHTPQKSDFFHPLFADAWDSSIATVIYAGNNPGLRLGDSTSQRFGREDNPLITVGSIDKYGLQSSFSTE
ncbi:hypothetical protein MMC29_001693 [Sticta canariensis]|nr:hypothetical protein [Sticta canariensis]